MGLTPQIIIKTVAEYFHQDELNILSMSQERVYVTPRQLSMYFMKIYTKKSLAEIGKCFHGRDKYKDHSTIIHAIKAVNNQIDTDKEYREAFRTIKRKLFKEGERTEGSFSTSTTINFRFYFIKKIRRYATIIIKEPVKFDKTEKRVSPYATIESANNRPYSGYRVHQL